MSNSKANPSPSISHGGFIPSIEGMRSLAVLVVLLFHLDVPGFEGGYLGVDLFFVISGFIITRNILWDLQGGSFSLKEFYRRRVRRLLPALLVTVLVTLLVSLFVLPPFVLVSTAKAAVFSVFSLANFYFWSGSGYFDAAAITKPLLHTWSLSLEEQFYLFWPALLLMLATTRWRLIMCVSILSLSLFFSLLWQHEFPDAIFYLLPFRLHQLMAGALIAIISLRLQGSSGNIFTLLGAGGFLAITIVLDGSYSAAVGAAAVAGLGFLLLVGREATLANMLFGNQPMQWIGQRSYALYLAHWPIIVIFNFAVDGQLTTISRMFLLFLSFVLAMALHEFVEKPFRKKGEDTTTAQRMAFPATLATLLVTVCLAAFIWRSDGFPSRIDPQIQRVVDSVEHEIDVRRRAIRFGSCNLHMMHKFSDYDIEKCASLDPARKNILVIGDSMAADMYIMLVKAYPEYKFSQASAGGCTAVFDISDVGGKYPTCEALNEYRFSELVRLDMDLIVLASIWQEDRIQPLKETVAYLHSLGKKVLIIGPRVHFRGAVPMLISRENSLDGINFSVRNRVVDESSVLRQMREAIPDVAIVDIGAMQCEPSCDVIEGDKLLYYDERHFTELGAQRIGERFKEAFDLPNYIDASDH